MSTTMSVTQAKKELKLLQNAFKAVGQLEEVIKVAEQAHSEVAALEAKKVELNGEIHALRQEVAQKRAQKEDLEELRRQEHEAKTKVRIAQRELEQLKRSFSSLDSPQGQE